jgi:hypothetical protein
MIGSKKLLRGAVLVMTLAAMAACGPRGETKSLDEVLQIARDRYEHVKGAQVAGDVRTALDQIGSDLQDLTKAPAAAKAADVAQLLSSLGTKAAYTTRPALAELVTQYRVMGSDSASAGSPARVKLLVSRTYHMLAAEMETTKFAVS